MRGSSFASFTTLEGNYCTPQSKPTISCPLTYPRFVTWWYVLEAIAGYSNKSPRRVEWLWSRAHTTYPSQRPDLASRAVTEHPIMSPLRPADTSRGALQSSRSWFVIDLLDFHLHQLPLPLSERVLVVVVEMPAVCADRAISTAAAAVELPSWPVRQPYRYMMATETTCCMSLYLILYQ